MADDGIELNVLLNNVFETMTDGIFVHDQDGKIIQANTALLTLFEAQPEEIIGRYDQQLLAYFKASTKQGHLLSVKQVLSSQILYQHVQEQLKLNNVYLTLGSGREIVVNITCFPMLNQKKQSIGCISVIHDITAQTQKESRIFHAFNSLFALVESLASVPDEEQLPSINAEEQTPPINNKKRFCARKAGEQALPITMAGKSMTEVIKQVLGCQFVEVFLLENLEGRKHVIAVSALSPHEEELIRQGTECALISDFLDTAKIDQLRANQIVRLDLREQPFVTPHPDFGACYRLLVPMVLCGKLFGAFVIAKASGQYADVTEAYSPEEIALARDIARFTALLIERVRLLQAWAETNARELALQETSSRYDVFMSIASHELRTPLTSFKGNAELALRRLEKLIQQVEDEPPFLKSLEGIKQPLSYAISRANMQARMITDLLDSSRIQQTHILNMLMEPLDLFAIVRSTIDDIRLSIADRVILFQARDEYLPLRGDAERIGQVVFNYISNALKYSPVTAPIEVCIARKGTSAFVSVHDNGPGLSIENQAKIWERFYQAPDVAVQYEAGVNGLGLGLYLNRKIIEQHHGQVGVQSIPGEGSIFWFDLPLMPSTHS